MNSQNLITGCVVALVGFFSSFAIVLHGLVNVGASSEQAASGLMMASVAMGISGVVLSLWKKQPISCAWSTPGAAFLATTGLVDVGMGAVVGAFIFAGLLTVIAGLWKPLGKLAAAIPAALAQAMLAGVLFALCIVPFKGMVDAPLIAIPIVLVWFVASRISRLYAVPAAVVAAVITVLMSPQFSMPEIPSMLASPVWVKPVFSWQAIAVIGVPFFIISMATQNIPGVAILKSYGYTPKPGPLFASVGLASALSAPLVAISTCVAAITLAMCANEESHPDPHKRYWSAVVAGIAYCVLGLFAGVIALIAAAAPAFAVATLAGVALFGVFSNALSVALESTTYREASAITFLVTASGVSLFGLGAAVTGLLAGCIIQLIANRRTQNTASSQGAAK